MLGPQRWVCPGIWNWTPSPPSPRWCSVVNGHPDSSWSPEWVLLFVVCWVRDCPLWSTLSASIPPLCRQTLRLWWPAPQQSYHLWIWLCCWCCGMKCSHVYTDSKGTGSAHSLVCAECQSRGEMRAHPDWLWPVRVTSQSRPEHVSGAGWSSAQRPLSAHLKFHSAPVKSLHALSDLKERAIPDVAPIWPVCLLFDTRESVWTCAV